uniref:Nucleoporin Nup88 n=1 Tax=Phlebotomus papatasi TaxID=29031 RepID=A0A1B0DF47_PHLPP
THILDDRLFTNNTHLEVLQVKWHPGSPTGSHLIVLLSDNSLRVYHEENLKHVWRIGPVPKMKSNGSTLPSLSDFGDTAVDFDIAPPRVSSLLPFGEDTMSESTLLSASAQLRHKVEWPILILRGNGNVYILSAGLSTKKPRLQGPLTMTPGKLDNYGLSSCSILVIPCLPSCVVISESTGKIHHCLLLEVDEEEAGNESFDKIDSSLQISPSEWRLHVLETVELELGLPQNSDSKSHVCPIHLRRDLATESRYFAYHNTGVHAIFLEFVKQLHDFAEAEDEADTEVPYLGNESRAEYILCTKALNSGQVNPVLGFTLLQSPAGLVVFLGSGQVVSLNLITDPNVLLDWNSEKSQKTSQATDAVSPQKKYFADSIETRILSILKGGLSQPLLKLSYNTEPSPQELLELLMHATQTLREQYFPRHEKCRQELKKRVEILQVLNRQQQEEIQELKMEKKRIRDNAENLAGKYEDMYERQQSLSKRAQEVARLVSLLAPSTLQDEKDFAQQVEKINVATKGLLKQLEVSKGKISRNQQQIETWEKQNIQKEFQLPPKREEVIKKILADMKSQINNQIMEIKQINKMLDI